MIVRSSLLAVGVWLTVCAPARPAPRPKSAGAPRLAWRYLPPHKGNALLLAGDAKQAFLFSAQAGDSTRNGGRLQALETTTGRKLWHSDFGSRVTQGVLDERAIYATSGQGITALDRQSGRKLWTHAGRPDSPFRAVVGEGRLVYCQNQRALIGIDATSGDEVWRRVWNEPEDLAVQVSPLQAFRGQLLVSKSATQDDVLVLDPHTGATQRQVRFYGKTGDAYALGYPTWSEPHRLLLFPELRAPVGSTLFSIGAVTPEFKLSWRAEGVAPFVQIGEILVAQAWRRSHLARLGTAGISVKTGKRLWTRQEAVHREDTVVGALRGSAVFVWRHEKTRDARGIIGVRPRDGSVAWQLSQKPQQADIYGDTLISVAEGNPKKPPIIQAYR